MRTSDEIFPALPKGLEMPFYCASLSSLWVYYRVDPESARHVSPSAPWRGWSGTLPATARGGREALWKSNPGLRVTA